MQKDVSELQNELDKLWKNDVDVTAQQRLIDSFLKKKQESNNIKLKYGRTRNVIFVGRIRSGKSTAIKMMKDPFRFHEQPSYFSETKEPVMNSFTVDTIREMTLQEAKDAGMSEDEVLKAEKIENSQSDSSPELQKYRISIDYNINILDTPGFPGLFQTHYNAKDNMQLKNIISKCVELEVTKIHMIFFVFSLECGISAEDVEIMIMFMQLFEAAENKMALLISNSEDYSLRKQENIKSEITRTREMKEVLSKVGDRIFFSGVLQKTHYDRGSTINVIDKLNNILLMRTKFYNYLFKDDTFCYLNELKFSVNHRLLAEKLLQEVKELSLAVESQTMEKEALKEGKETLQKKGQELDGLMIFLNNQMGLKTQAEQLLAKIAWINLTF